ncbi:unnamed protein product [Closterium sp. Yama58-4]|nr:unnamed protein product [Closterium sp. Yama58-4]
MLLAISVISIHPATESSRSRRSATRQSEFDRPIACSHEEHLPPPRAELEFNSRRSFALVQLAPLACSGATRACAPRRVASAAAFASGGGRAGTLWSVLVAPGAPVFDLRDVVYAGTGASRLVSCFHIVTKRPDGMQLCLGY